MILTADQVRARVRAVIAERYESQAQAARNWGVRPQDLNDALNGRGPVPNAVLDRLGIKRVILYEDGKPE